MSATMDKPTVIPVRWWGHGISLRMVDVDGAWWFFLDDILAVTGPVATQVETIELPDQPEASAPTLLVAGTAVLLLGADVPPARRTPTLDEFFAWFESELAAWTSERDEHKARIEEDDAGYTAPTLFDVATSARILSRDAAIGELGRDRLFALLERVGWAERDAAGHWAPTAAVRNHGWATRIPTRIKDHNGRPGEVYRQLALTPEGLAELHRLLGGLSPLAITVADDEIDPLVGLS